jgi:ABC-2 type transport system permease protein
MTILSAIEGDGAGGHARSLPAAAGRQPGRLLSIDQESGIFMRLRGAMARAAVAGMLRSARLRLSLVLLLSAVFWGSLYGLFSEAFGFLDSLHSDVVSLLFNAFFSSLMVMLVFSSGILLYSGMYDSREARLLLTLPVRPEAIFAHKFKESLWFSSWGFVLLGSPMLVAYGAVVDAPWTYFALLLPFMVAFVVIPATLGGMLCMALVAWLPRRRIEALVLLLVAAVAAAGWIGWSAVSAGGSERLSTAWFERAFARLAVTEQRVLPSWWLTSGLIEASRRGETAEAGRAALGESLRFLAVLVANGLLLQLVAGLLARGIYRTGYGRLAGETRGRRRRRAGWFDRFITDCGTPAGRPLRLLLVKDLRLFRRDLSQWSQFVIFFGLLALYFANVRSFRYTNTYASIIGFLNLAVVGLILSTFTTRFVYPMISLEGRRFWILGLLPVHRDQIVWSKFLFSFGGSIVPCCGLVLLSDVMLGIPALLVVLHEICCLMLCMGLAGIAVGLGARMPDLRESSPSKISAGFGGTLSLVVSSLFIMIVVVMAAVPAHLNLARASIGPDVARLRGLVGWLSTPAGLGVSMLGVVAVGLLATVLPMALGLRAFRKMELT